MYSLALCRYWPGFRYSSREKCTEAKGEALPGLRYSPRDGRSCPMGLNPDPLLLGPNPSPMAGDDLRAADGRRPRQRALRPVGRFHRGTRRLPLSHHGDDYQVSGGGAAVSKTALTGDLPGPDNVSLARDSSPEFGGPEPLTCLSGNRLHSYLYPPPPFRRNSRRHQVRRFAERRLRLAANLRHPNSSVA